MNGLNHLPSGVVRFLVANGVELLAQRGDPIAQKCYELICVMQAMGLAKGTEDERKAEGGTEKQAAPQVPESAPESAPESGKFSAVNRMKPFLN